MENNFKICNTLHHRRGILLQPLAPVLPQDPKQNKSPQEVLVGKAVTCSSSRGISPTAEETVEERSGSLVLINHKRSVFINANAMLQVLKAPADETKYKNNLRGKYGRQLHIRFYIHAMVKMDDVIQFSSNNQVKHRLVTLEIDAPTIEAQKHIILQVEKRPGSTSYSHDT
ncbi:hypothetical protein C0J52_25754 [Blattella germanica]|nr:hypothetical protein C0J52_25754 [Blattella germanica]